MQNRETESSFSRLTPVDQYLTISLFNERKKDYPTGVVHELFPDLRFSVTLNNL